MEENNFSNLNRKQEIEKKRKELYSISKHKKGSLLDSSLLKISKELDVLINEIYGKRKD